MAEVETQVDNNVQISLLMNLVLYEIEGKYMSYKTEMSSKSVQVKSSNADNLVSPVSRPRSTYKQLQASGAGEYILDLVQNGYKLPFKRFLVLQKLHNNKSTLNSPVFVSKEIITLLLKVVSKIEFCMW